MGTQSARNGGLPWWHSLVGRRALVPRRRASARFPARRRPALPCNYFTQIASRVPFDPTATAATAMFQGASMPAPGGLPLGTELFLTSDRFDVAAGRAVPGDRARARAAQKHAAAKRASVALRAAGRLDGRPATATLGDVERRGTERDGDVHGHVAGDRRRRPGAAIAATLTAAAQGDAATTDRGRPRRPGRARARCSALPQVAQFERWARDAGVPQLGGLVKPVLSIGVGETRSVRVDLHNWSGATQSGTVSLDLPAGFPATPRVARVLGARARRATRR